MGIEDLSERVFPNDGDGETHPAPLTADIGAAGLLIEASLRDGAYTEVERDLVTGTLMKLFRLPRPKAVELRKTAEAAQARSTTIMGFATSAAKLSADDRAQLVTCLWQILGSDDAEHAPESQVLGTTESVFGLTRQQLLALRPKDGA